MIVNVAITSNGAMSHRAVRAVTIATPTAPVSAAACKIATMPGWRVPSLLEVTVMASWHQSTNRQRRANL